MITIHNLEIRFDVEGDDDRETFARLFNEFITRWSAGFEEQQQREMDLTRERRLGTGTPGV